MRLALRNAMGKSDGEDGGKMDGVGLPCELDDWEWSTAIVEDLSFFGVYTFNCFSVDGRGSGGLSF